MKTIRRIAAPVIGLCVVAAIGIVAFSFLSQEDKGKLETSTEYCIILSDMLKSSGKLIELDARGKCIGERKINLQDVNAIDCVSDCVIAGGHRANNNILFNKNGEYKTFALLNNTDYSGVTAISHADGRCVALMNGNIEGNTYLNLLVVQDEDNNVERKQELDIFASDLICENGTVFIVGAYLKADDDIWNCEVIKTDLEGSENAVIKKIYDKNTEYQKVISCDNELYCLSKSTKTQESKSIDILDKESLERLYSIKTDANGEAIFAIDGAVYVVINQEIFKIKDRDLLKTGITMPQNTYIDNYVSNGDNVSFYCRYESPENKNDTGYIVEYSGGDSTKEIPLLIEEEYDNLIFFPRRYLGG